MSFGSGIKKLAKEIANRYRYVRGQKGVLENPHKQLKQWRPEGSFDKVGRAAGLAGIDLTWFLFCLMKYTAKDSKNSLNAIFLDNALIDKWEKDKENIKTKKDDSSFQRFFKNLQKSHPRVAAKLQLWMVYALMTMGLVGGKSVYDNRDEIKQFVKLSSSIPSVLMFVCLKSVLMLLCLKPVLMSKMFLCHNTTTTGYI